MSSRQRVCFCCRTKPDTQACIIHGHILCNKNQEKKTSVKITQTSVINLLGEPLSHRCWLMSFMITNSITLFQSKWAKPFKGTDSQKPTSGSQQQECASESSANTERAVSFTVKNSVQLIIPDVFSLMGATKQTVDSRTQKSKFMFSVAFNYYELFRSLRAKLWKRGDCQRSYRWQHHLLCRHAHSVQAGPIRATGSAISPG